MWGVVCLIVIQEKLTNNVSSWDKYQSWGGLCFAMQRQGRKKRAFRKWTAKAINRPASQPPAVTGAGRGQQSQESLPTMVLQSSLLPQHSLWHSLTWRGIYSPQNGSPSTPFSRPSLFPSNSHLFESCAQYTLPDVGLCVCMLIHVSIHPSIQPEFVVLKKIASYAIY